MDALDLPHLDKGPRGAPAVVLLHGFPLDHAMWAPQTRALEAAGFRVIAPDLRGLGKGPGPGRGPGTMATYAADVLRLVDRVGARVTGRLDRLHVPLGEPHGVGDRAVLLGIAQR